MSKEKKIPLKGMLQAIDHKNKDYYDSFDDDQKKEFSSWMAMRYASSVDGYYAIDYLLMVNDFVNPDFSALYKHPELQWKLLTLAGVGSNQFHPYIPPPKRKAKDKLQEALLKLNPLLNDDELEIVQTMSSKQDLRDMFESSGYTNKEIKEILNKK